MTNPSMSEALQEAYASADPDQVIIEALSIYYDGLARRRRQPGGSASFSCGDNPTSVSDDGVATLLARLEIERGAERRHRSILHRRAVCGHPAGRHNRSRNRGRR
jgi:hypothetical protein